MGNAATAIMALQALASRLTISQDHIRQGLLNVHLQGRFEKLHDQPLVITDVAHNPHAVSSLVTQLQTQVVEGSTRIVIAMLADKPVDEVISLLLPSQLQTIMASPSSINPNKDWLSQGR